MRYFNKHKQQFHCPTINVEKIWSLVPAEVKSQYASAGADDKLPVIDVTKAGIFKVLGKGVMPSQPVIVKAKFFSKVAEEKIKATGGVAILTC